MLCARLGVRLPHEFILGLHDGVKYADYIPVYIVADVGEGEYAKARVFHHYADRKVPYCLFLMAMLKYLNGEYYPAGVLLGLAIHILQDIVSRYEIFMMSDIKRLRSIHKSIEHELYRIVKEKLNPDFVNACIEGKLNASSVLEDKLCTVVKETYDMLLRFLKFEVPIEKHIVKRESIPDMLDLEFQEELRKLKRGLAIAIASLLPLVVPPLVSPTLWVFLFVVFMGIILLPLAIFGIVQTIRSAISIVRKKISARRVRKDVIVVGELMSKRDAILRQIFEKCSDITVSEDVIRSSDVIKQLARKARKRKKRQVA